MKNNTITVTQLNEFLKMTVDASPYLASVCVYGEISNFKHHFASGHLYFTLKDSTSQLKCVMFRTDAARLKFDPSDGMKVICTGSVKVYTAGGTYQLYTNDILPDGVGQLYAAYEQLKAKLEAEGIFSDKIKRPIPKFPEKLGVITSQTGAAVRDIINITSRRYPLCEIYVYPAIVQGEYAEKTLIDGLEYFNNDFPVDTLIIGRGGGSIEDLWAFNSEKLAYAIRRSKIPVISAVGHETDFTICDFVSDLRAPTPSAAAELAVPDAHFIMNDLEKTLSSMMRNVNGKIDSERKKLEKTAGSRALSSLDAFISDRRLLLDNISNKLENHIKLIISEKRRSYEKAAATLDGNSPLKILSSGYALAIKGDTVIDSIDIVNTGDDITISVKDGKINATVTGVFKND